MLAVRPEGSLTKGMAANGYSPTLTFPFIQIQGVRVRGEFKPLGRCPWFQA